MTMKGVANASRVPTIAACILISASASGCKREHQAPPPPPGSVAGAPIDAPGAAAAPAQDRSGAVSVAPADLPAPDATPLRVVFGERGAGVSYVAARADGLHVVHGGRASRAVGAIDQIGVSPDGKRVAFAAEVDGVWRMLVDGEPVAPATTSAGAPAFSPDSSHVAYDATVDGKRRLVVDGRPGPERFDFVGRPAFSNDSALVAFAEIPEEGKPSRLVVADRGLKRQRVVCEGVVRFLADEAGVTLAAVIGEGEEQRVVVSPFSLEGVEKAEPAHGTVSALAFGTVAGTVAYVAERGGERFLVAGGREKPLKYDEVGEVAYGSRGIAFAARRGERWVVVVDGRAGSEFDRVVTPRFSPDGKFLVYRARRDGKRFVVIADANGKTIRELPPYEQVFPVIFTPDGKSITYGVKDGIQLYWRVEPL